MTGFTSSPLIRLILGDLPFPETVQELGYEDELAQMKADLLADFPDAADVINLETDPLVIMLERLAEEKVKLKGQINDDARKNTLAHGLVTAWNFAAFWGLQRHVIIEADPDAIPPIEEVLEADEEFKARIQLAPEGLTVAGSPGSYKFHSLNASPLVKDADTKRGGGGETILYILSREGDGTADQALLDLVFDYTEERRPLCTTLTMASTNVTQYTLEAEISFIPSFDKIAVLARAEAAAQAYVTAQHKIRHDVTIAGLYHALFQDGVHNIQITSPATDIINGIGEAAYCTGITLTDGGEDV